jgi:hypothetical protein
MSEVLGSLSFLETPDVNGIPLLAQGDAATTVLGTADQIAVTGTVASPIIGLASNAVVPGTQSMTLPGGVTSQRPVIPLPGMIRYNATLGYNEKYTGAYWGPFGLLLQLVTGNISSSTGTTQIPFDNTTPLITEGHQIWTTSFTPISATSQIIINYTMLVATSTAGRFATTSVFFGTPIVSATSTLLATTNSPYNLCHQAVFVPGSTATITLQARCGLNNTGTLSINQSNATNLNGSAVTRYTIMEIE